MQRYKLVDEDYCLVAEGTVESDADNYAVKHDGKLYTWAFATFGDDPHKCVDTFIETPLVHEHTEEPTDG